MKPLAFSVSLWGIALVLLVVASAQGSDEDRDGPPSFDGQYRLAINSEVAEAHIHEAIDEGVEGMRRVRRRIGHRRLRAKNPLVEQIAIATQPDRITIVLDDDRYTAPRDGRLVDVILDDGEEVRVSHRMRDDQIIQRFVGDDGVRTNTFTLGNGGQRLLMAVKVTSDQLPNPVRYRVPYFRR